MDSSNTSSNAQKRGTVPKRPKRKITSDVNDEPKRTKVERDSKDQSRANADVKVVASAQEPDYQKDFLDTLTRMKELNNEIYEKSDLFTSWNESIQFVGEGIRDKRFKSHREICEKVHGAFSSAIDDPNNRRTADKLRSTHEEVKTMLEKMMKSYGYCCGQSYKHSLSKVFCKGCDDCRVQRGQLYYYSEYKISDEDVKEINFCENHWKKQKQEIVTEDGIEKTMKASIFKHRRHFEEPEQFVECKECGIKCHMICAGIGEDQKARFKCNRCVRVKIRKNWISSKFLVHNRCSFHIEKGLKKFLKTQLGAGATNVSVRLLYSNKKNGEMHELMEECFGSDTPEFPYIHRFIAAFQVIDGKEVMFFAMNVQEYDAPEKRWANIEWLDSVKYFQPNNLKSEVYKKIMNLYFEYIASRGIRYVHIWASAPGNRDDYLFNLHPSTQLFPEQNGLEKWYTVTLETFKKSGTVKSIKHELKSRKNANIKSVLKSLYFDGGFLEATLKDIKKENCKGNELKNEIEAAFSASKERLFYVELAKIPQNQDKERSIESKIAKDRESWIQEQMNNKWNFGTLREAQYATQMILERLINERGI